MLSVRRLFSASPMRLLSAATLPVAMAALLVSCGQRDLDSATTVKAPEALVATESGPLPAAGTAQRLLGEQSAFLRHHAQDAVDWYPWGTEAFNLARDQQKMILVSIGYTSCPWSQKMQEQSFLDPAVARFMNRHFVNVLVDREERPDVNNSFLHYLFWRDKQSGWPLHMWLTPEGLPVYSGVYFPKESEDGKPSWPQTLELLANSWNADPAYVKRQAEYVALEYMKSYRKYSAVTEPALDQEALAVAFEKLRTVFDPVNGGFSGAPKFPQPQALLYLLNFAARTGDDRVGRSREAMGMVTLTMDRILAGGIFDQLGGGLHRYSTDIYWAVPQFEKMLYDQATFSEALINAGAMLGREDYLDGARAVLKYTENELGHPDGGFYCAEGSSSPVKAEGASLEEGSFYLWQTAEVEAAAGAAAMPLLNRVYGLEVRGNLPIDSPVRSRFPGANVLRREQPMEQAAKAAGMTVSAAQQTLQEANTKLLEARRQRPRPILDNKVLASWNGSMISALARLAWVAGDDAALARGVRAAEFILKRLRHADGTLLHAFLDSPSTAPGYSEDYAMVIRGLLDLYEATGEAGWLRTAVEIQDRQIEQLWDAKDGGFFDGPPQPLLFNRMKSHDESTEFAPGAVSVMNLLRLSHLAGRADFQEKAGVVLKNFGSPSMRAPGGFLRLLLAFEAREFPFVQVVVSGSPDAPDRAAMLKELRRSAPTGRVILYLDGGEGQEWLTKAVPALTKLAAQPGRTTVYLCRDFQPIHTFTTPDGMGPALMKEVQQP